MLTLQLPGQVKGFGTNQFGQLGTVTNNRSANPNPIPTDVPIPGRTKQIRDVRHDPVWPSPTTGGCSRSAPTSTARSGARSTPATAIQTSAPTQVTLPGATGSARPGRGRVPSTRSCSPPPARSSASVSPELAGAARQPPDRPAADPRQDRDPRTPPARSIQVAAGAVYKLRADQQRAGLRVGRSTTTGSSASPPMPEPSPPIPRPPSSGCSGATGPRGRDRLRRPAHARAHAAAVRSSPSGATPWASSGARSNLGTETANPTPATRHATRSRRSRSRRAHASTPTASTASCSPRSGRVFGFGRSSVRPARLSGRRRERRPGRDHAARRAPCGRDLGAGLSHTLIVPDDLRGVHVKRDLR